MKMKKAGIKMDSKDLVKALQNCGGKTPYGECFRNCHYEGNRPCSKLRDELIRDAADTIERLEAENAALRAQLEQPNKPLTLDELREMVLQPVYIVSNDISWWEIINWISEEYFHGRIGSELPLDSLGKTWLAYRRRGGLIA